MDIKVIGSGCPTCQELHQRTSQVAKELGLPDPTYLPDVMELVKRQIMRSPVVLVDDEPVVVGYLPSISELTKILETKKCLIFLHRSQP